MKTIVDLRSDTVTRPSPEMRAAMAAAEVGDDVFGEDPTVTRLQEEVARVTGKEAALFVPSGTMANQLALRSQTHLGDEVLAVEGSHFFEYESGGAAAISGLLIRLLPGDRGVIGADQIEGHLRPADPHHAPVTLVGIEQTHNRAGGAVFPLPDLQDIRRLTLKRELAFHMDGARIFNASVAADVPVREYAATCDTVSFCFSKGLGAPVGSVLAGGREVIDRARRFRKMLGGGMRQAGIIAAGALYALEHHVERLQQDHRRASDLANGIRELSGFRVANDPPDTNIVLIDVEEGRPDAPAVCAALASEGLRCLAIASRRIRLVTHLDVDDLGIEWALRAFRAVAG